MFLKSTDDSMIDTLQKMSGTTHRVRANSRTITHDTSSFFEMNANEGKVSITQTANEEPLIMYNDFAFIPERNSIVFRAGDSPIWNRNEMILPMSWRLFEDTIEQPGKTYSLQTIPTLSSAMDFNVRQNQPDFGKMLQKRMEQAFVADDAKAAYQMAYDYSDFDIEQLDLDNYSDEIMQIISETLNPVMKEDDYSEEEFEMMEWLNDEFNGEDEDYTDSGSEPETTDWYGSAETNDEQLQTNMQMANQQKERQKPIFAGGMLSKEDLISAGGGVTHQLDNEIIAVYKDIRGAMEQDTRYFTFRNGSLCGTDGLPFIRVTDTSEQYEVLKTAAKEDDQRVFEDGTITKGDINNIGSYEVMDAFYRFLEGFNGPWPFANGEFERRMADRIQEDNNS